MNQRESVLVYTVTAILAILVLGAVVLGGGEEPASAGEKGDGTVAAGTEGAVDPVDLLEIGTVGEDAPGAAGAEDIPAAPASPPVLSDAELREIELRRRFGPFEVIDNGGPQRWRQITVRQGETLSGLVQRWTGSGELMEDVVALNEGLRRNSNVRAGQTLYMPWVAPEILLARDRGTSPANVPLRRSSAPAARSGQPVGVGAGGGAAVDGAALGFDLPVPDDAGQPAAESSSYQVQNGESLWTIAARRVGRARADAYVKEIVARNNSISDPSRVRAGQSILLPAVR